MTDHSNPFRNNWLIKYVFEETESSCSTRVVMFGIEILFNRTATSQCMIIESQWCGVCTMQVGNRDQFFYSSNLTLTTALLNSFMSLSLSRCNGVFLSCGFYNPLVSGQHSDTKRNKKRDRENSSIVVSCLKRSWPWDASMEHLRFSVFGVIDTNTYVKECCKTSLSSDLQ